MAYRYIKIILVAIAIVAMEGCNNPPSPVSYDVLNGKVKNGDIILRKGYGIVSSMICSALNDTVKLSHCGVIVVDSLGNAMVVHSLSRHVSHTDGVQSCTLDEFLKESVAGSVRVRRLIVDGKRADSVGMVIAAEALSYLDRRIPFDDQYDIKDNSKLFCSELPIEIFKNCLGVDILPNGFDSGSIPRFSIFLNEDLFEKVF